MNVLKVSLMKKKKNVDLQKPSPSKDDVSIVSTSTSSLNSSFRRRSSSSSISTRGYCEEEMNCLKKLSAFCKDTDREISSELIFRIAHFHDFDFKKAKHGIITSAGKRYMNLRMQGDLVEHFEKSIIFPLPDLTAKDGSKVVYVRPSRYAGKTKRSSQLMIESLCYVLNDLSRTKGQCRNGITVVVNMKNWARDNFDQEMWIKMIRILQGDMVPTKVRQVLIVDAPPAFEELWELLEQLMSYSFFKNVRFIKQNKLDVFFNGGYHEYLPNDFKRGWLDGDEVTEDYIDQKRYDDQQEPQYDC